MFFFFFFLLLNLLLLVDTVVDYISILVELLDDHIVIINLVAFDSTTTVTLTLTLTLAFGNTTVLVSLSNLSSSMRSAILSRLLSYDFLSDDAIRPDCARSRLVEIRRRRRGLVARGARHVVEHAVHRGHHVMHRGEERRHAERIHEGVVMLLLVLLLMPGATKVSKWIDWWHGLLIIRLWWGVRVVWLIVNEVT